MKTLLRCLLFVACCCPQAQLWAQPTARFAEEISAFERQDATAMPPKGITVFVGSSSIRLWQSLQSDFPGTPVINRGFGGASIPDVVRYAEQTIYRYQPSRIVFYCGENDLADSDTLQASSLTQRFIDFFGQVRKRLPAAQFVFISIKPSPSRARMMYRVVAANEQIKSFLSRQPNTRYVDVFGPMLLPNGKPRGELFTADSLHMNAGGYAIWREQLRPVMR